MITITRMTLMVRGAKNLVKIQENKITMHTLKDSIDQLHEILSSTENHPICEIKLGNGLWMFYPHSQFL